MIKRILVVLSSYTDSSLLIDESCALAADAQAELLGLFLERPPDASGFSLPTVRANCADGRLNVELPVLPQEIREQLDAIERSIRKNSKLFLDKSRNAGIRSRFISEKGDPLEVMLDKGAGTDLILICSPQDEGEDHQAEALKAVEDLCIGSGRPVLIVPRIECSSKRVLVAYDGAVPAARVLRAVAEYSVVCQLEHIDVLAVTDDQDQYSKIKAVTNDYLRAYDFEVTCKQGTGKVVDEIVTYAEEIDAGVVALGAYGSPKIKTALFGSTTREILKNLRSRILLTA